MYEHLDKQELSELQMGIEDILMDIEDLDRTGEATVDNEIGQAEMRLESAIEEIEMILGEL